MAVGRPIYKLIEGYGFVEVLTDAGLLSPGKQKGFSTGKGWETMMRCHAALVEALERLFLDHFRNESPEHHSACQKLEDELEGKHVDGAAEHDLLQSEAFDRYNTLYSSFMSRAADPDDATCGGQNGAYLCMYLEAAWSLLRLEEAVKSNDWATYLDALDHHVNLHFAFGGINFSRWGAWELAKLTHLDRWWPGIDAAKAVQNSISVSMSDKPDCRSHVDKRGEEIIMGPMKSTVGMGQGGFGVTGIVHRINSTARWLYTVSHRGGVAQLAVRMAGMGSGRPSTKHPDRQPAAVGRSEGDVIRVIEGLLVFGNPVSRDTSQLVNMLSGRLASDEVTTSLLTAVSKGRAAKETFLRDRFPRPGGADPQTEWVKPVKNLKLRTFKDTAPRSLAKTTRGSQVNVPTEWMSLWQVIVHAANRLGKVSGDDMTEFLLDVARAPLSTVPHSLATVDGCLRKRNKAGLSNAIIKEAGNVSPPDPGLDDKTINIVDGNAIAHGVRVSSTKTFGDVAFAVFNQCPRHDEAMVFSWDAYYNVQADVFEEAFGKDAVPSVSAKEMTQVSRGEGTRNTSGRNPTSARPHEWAEYVKNDSNKVDFSRTVQTQWSSQHGRYAGPVDRRGEVFIAVDTKLMRIWSLDGQLQSEYVLEGSSKWEETDNRIIQYILLARTRGYTIARVHTPDSDIFWLLQVHFRAFDGIRVTLVYGAASKRQEIDVGKVRAALPYTDDDWLAIAAFQIESGVDTTSASFGRRVVKATKKLIGDEAAKTAYRTLGTAWDSDNIDFAGIEKFVCKLYGTTQHTTVTELRLHKLTQLCKGDLSKCKKVDLRRLPPPQAALRQHIIRANYQMCLWRFANDRHATIPSPIGHGWVRDEASGATVPEWLPEDCSVLPTFLADSVEDMQHDETEDDTDDQDGDFDDEEDEESTDTDSDSDNSENESDT
jgi:hypothetical protein